MIKLLEKEPKIYEKNKIYSKNIKSCWKSIYEPIEEMVVKSNGKKVVVKKKNSIRE